MGLWYRGAEMSDVGLLVEAVRQGDLDAFNAVVRRFQGMAYAVAYDRVGDAHLAEDAAQEAFLEAYFALTSLREPAAFPGWFRRIVVKQGDRLTRGPQHTLLPLEAAATLATPEPEPAACAEQRELQTLMRA